MDELSVLNVCCCYFEIVYWNCVRTFLRTKMFLLLMRRTILDGMLVGMLASGCAPKRPMIEAVNAHVYCPIHLARLVAASVIQKEQIHEGYYWVVYEEKRENYTLLYKPSGRSGGYLDDILLLEEGRNPHYEYGDIGVLGEVNFIISLKNGAMIPYSFLPEDEQLFHQQKYLSGLLDVAEMIKRTEDIKALEQITPP